MNTVRTCQIRFEHSGGEVPSRETTRIGIERSQKAKVGDLIGAECANDTEPYIVCEVTQALQTWQGVDGWSWMGAIKAGDEYLTCVKYQKRGGEKMYTETDRSFYLLAGDCRIIFEEHQEVARARSSNRSTTQTTKAKMYMVDATEMDKLKNRVYSIARDDV